MDGNLGMAMLFEYFPLEREVRVQQPPKIRKIIGVPTHFYWLGKTDAERKNYKFITVEKFTTLI